jgi:hypothetical protein
MDWPTGWREKVLSDSGIPETRFALDVLSAWERSTPTEQWTNNPLGIPYERGRTNRAMSSDYAAYPTIGEFYAAMKRYMDTRNGRQVVRMLVNADDLAATWREIHGMKWPANATESDYPHVLLDMIEDTYRSKMTNRQRGETQGTGIVNASHGAHAAVRMQAAALHHAANHFNNAADALASIMRGMA